MIRTLTGRIARLDPVPVIEVGGVGFEVNVPESNRDGLGSVGDEATLHTYLAVREDSLTLFGFADEEERGLFIQLLGVGGVGPRLALAILSGLPAAELVAAIESGSVAALTRVTGVGRKTAQRIVLDLKEKVSRYRPAPKVMSAGAALGVGEAQEEARLALVQLGLSRSAAEDALAKASADDTAKDAGVEEWVRAALRFTQS